MRVLVGPDARAAGDAGRPARRRRARRSSTTAWRRPCGSSAGHVESWRCSARARADALRSRGRGGGAGARSRKRTSPAPSAGHEVRVARAGDLPRGGLRRSTSRREAPRRRSAAAGRGGAAAARPARRSTCCASRTAGRGTAPTSREENLLHETGPRARVPFAAKGCYVGQEVIARLEARGGNVNKPLRGLRLGAPAAAGRGRARRGHRRSGRVTTAGVSPRLGPIAMALRPPQPLRARHARWRWTARRPPSWTCRSSLPRSRVRRP